MSATYVSAGSATQVENISFSGAGGKAPRARKWTAYAAAGVLVGSGAWLSAPVVRGLVTGTQTHLLAAGSSTTQQTYEEDLPRPSSVTDDIGVIRTTLGLSVAEIAKVTGKSRQAVYKWISGESQPEAATSDAVAQLADVGRRMSDAGIRRPHSAVHMGMFNGASLLDIIIQGQMIDSHVQAVIDEALSGQEAYDAAAASRSNTPPTDHPDLDTLSV